METNELVALGYALQMSAFAVLSALYLGWRRRYPFSMLLGLASVVTALSGGLLTLRVLGYLAYGPVVVLVEWMRILLWIVALFVVLRALDKRRLAETYMWRYGLPLLAAGLVGMLMNSSTHLDALSESLLVSGGVVLGVMLISVLEQIYRNLPSDSTSSLKYVCVSLFITSAYDILLSLHAISAGSLQTDLWAARGFVFALVAPTLAISAWRGDFEAAVDVPRQAGFYTFSLVATGASIVLWLVAKNYVDAYGGTWDKVAIIVLVTAAVCASSVLLVSASIRARLRVFLTKVFFKYKYDYRKEWLRFISTLSESGLEDVAATAIRAVGQIVSSPGGIVWVKEEEGNAYVPIGSWRCEIPAIGSIDESSELVRFLIDRQWVIDLEEKQRYPVRYDGLELGPCFHEDTDWWLIVPLHLGKRLFGFVWLTKPRVVRSLNFEDHDLLRTVGRHVAMHINQAESDRRLAESSQFGTYNRLTAFLMHDLNNLIAQQSLVVKNAEKFRGNPKFVDDAIDTIANSVSRMRRLMEQLSRDSKTPANRKTDLKEVLTNAVQRSMALSPEPTLQVSDVSIHVLADVERLTTVFEHLIRNAQDATAESGRIEIGVTVSDESALVSISDTGEGMSLEFIRERLFRPFDSTKGSHAMGIGVYQAREYTRMLRGQLEVKSKVGQGTTFVLALPIAK